jgi:ABC-2 type transport system ATP-binding protein
MQQAELLCDQIFMIHDGRKVLDGTMAQIRSRYDSRTLLLEPAGGDPAALAGLPGVRAVRADNGTVEVALDDGVEPHRAIAAIAGAIPVTRIELRRPTLEDVFVQIVSGGAADEAALREAVRETSALDARGAA